MTEEDLAQREAERADLDLQKRFNEHVRRSLRSQQAVIRRREDWLRDLQALKLRVPDIGDYAEHNEGIPRRR